MNYRILIATIFVGGVLSFSFGCSSKKDTKSEESNQIENVINEPEPEKAIAKYYRKFLQIKPVTPEDYMNKGFAHYYFGDLQKAKENYNEALKQYRVAQDKESAKEVMKYLKLTN